jgi:hypothetical protein
MEGGLLVSGQVPPRCARVLGHGPAAPNRSARRARHLPTPTSSGRGLSSRVPVIHAHTSVHGECDARMHCRKHAVKVSAVPAEANHAVAPRKPGCRSRTVAQARARHYCRGVPLPRCRRVLPDCRQAACPVGRRCHPPMRVTGVAGTVDWAPLMAGRFGEWPAQLAARSSGVTTRSIAVNRSSSYKEAVARLGGATIRMAVPTSSTIALRTVRPVGTPGEQARRGWSRTTTTVPGPRRLGTKARALARPVGSAQTNTKSASLSGGVGVDCATS